MTSPARAIDIIGGKDVIGRDVRGGIEMVRAVREGLPVAAVRHMIAIGRLTLAEVDRVVLPRKTLANRTKIGTLTPDQSNRLLRVARLVAMAEETFGNQEKAGRWLRRPTTALEGERPLDLLDTDEGARAVEALLGRISHGIAA